MEFLYSIIGGIITGVVSLIGIIVTYRFNKKNLAISEKEKRIKEYDSIIENRPEFELTSYKTFFDKPGYFEDASFDFDILMVFDNVKNKDVYNKKEEFVRVEYELKNIGKSLIECVDVISILNHLYLFNLSNNKINSLENTIFDAYKSVLYYGRKIRNGDRIKIRLWYHKDVIQESLINNALMIGCKSFNKKYWRQNLNAPRGLLEESELIGEKEYNKLTTGR